MRLHAGIGALVCAWNGHRGGGLGASASDANLGAFHVLQDLTWLVPQAKMMLHYFIHQLGTRVRGGCVQSDELSTEEVVTGGNATGHSDGEQSTISDQSVNGPDTAAQSSLVDLEPAGGYVSEKGGS